MAFKIAYCAGHYYDTPGKRVPASLDPAQPREWTLNDRVARYFAEAAGQYENVELLRTDDPTGKTFVDIPPRCAKANAWGADIYLDMHHNAGIGGGTGGGLVVYSYPGSEKGKAYRDAVYNAILAAGGIKGNRAQPLQEKAWDSLKLSYMPALLIEYGFMDSKTDYPIIITEAHAKLAGYATMEGIANIAGLQKKKAAPAPVPEDTPDSGYTLPQFVREVQSAIGAKADGVAGPETISKTVTLSAVKNDTHAAVLPVQKRLAVLGYSQVGTVDGVAGPKFESAVMAFQKDNGCVVDGEITAGNKTWRKLLGME